MSVVLVLFVYTSSRSFIALMKHLKINLSGIRFYRGYLKSHGYYWGILGIVLLFHVSMGIMHIALFSSPAAPDAYLHRYVLVAGLVGVLLLGTVVTSCRSLLGIFGITFLKNPLSVGRFAFFISCIRISGCFSWCRLSFIITLATFVRGDFGPGKSRIC
jgi:hypothetical protein